MRTLAEIELEVKRLAGIIEASVEALPTYGFSADFGRPHIEVGELEYHYVAVERGQEISRVSTSDLDDLLFQIFCDVTFHLAVEYELEHRIETQDCRRIIFRRQIELLSTLSPAWAGCESARHVMILDANPFDDFAGYYASRIADYHRAGFSYDWACKLATLATNKAKIVAALHRFMTRTPM